MNIKCKIINRIKNDFHLFELLKGSSVSFIFRFAGLGAAYILSLLVANIMGATSWGIYSLCLAVVTFLGIFARLGLDTALLRFNAELISEGKEGEVKSYNILSFKILFVTSLLLSLLLYFNSDFVATNIFQKPHLEKYFRVSSFAVLPLSFSILSSRALRGIKRISKSVFLEYMAKHIYFLIIFLLGIFFLNNFTDYKLIIVFVLVSFIVFIQSSYWHYREIEGYNTVELSSIEIKNFLKVSFPLLLASSMVYLKGWIDTFVIGIYLEESSIGIYNIALKLATLASLPLTAINTIAAPKFAENLNDKDSLQEVVFKSTKLIALTSMPILLMLIFFSELVLSFFGEEFIQAKTALIIIAIGSFINAISGSVGYFLQMTGKQVVFQNITVIVTILAVSLNFLLIPIFGINGAAVSSLITTFIWNISMVVYIRKSTGILTIYLPKIFKNRNR